MLLAMLLVAGGVAASLLLLSHELGSLHGTLSKNRAAGSLFSGPATTSPGQRARRPRHSTPAAQKTNKPTAPGPSPRSADSAHHAQAVCSAVLDQCWSRGLRSPPACC